MKADRRTVHEMTGEENKRHREPKRDAALQHGEQRDLREEKEEDDDLESRAAHPMRFVHGL